MSEEQQGQSEEQQQPEEQQQVQPPADHAVNEPHIKPEDLVKTLDAENAERQSQEDRVDLTVPPAEGETLPIHALLPQSLQPEAEQFAADIAAIATDRGLGRGMATAALNFVIDAAMTAGGIGDGSNPRETMNYLNTKYTAEGAKKVVADAQRAVAQLGPDVAAFLNQQDSLGRRLADNAAVVEMLAEFALGVFHLSPSQARAQLKTLQSMPEYKAGKPNVVARVRSLNAIIAQGKGGDHKGLADAAAQRKAPKVTPTAKSKLEAELKQIRMDPGYYKRDADNHKALVARVNAIYAELQPEGRR